MAVEVEFNCAVIFGPPSWLIGISKDDVVGDDCIVPMYYGPEFTAELIRKWLAMVDVEGPVFYLPLT